MAGTVQCPACPATARPALRHRLLPPGADRRSPTPTPTGPGWWTWPPR